MVVLGWIFLGLLSLTALVLARNGVAWYLKIDERNDVLREIRDELRTLNEQAQGARKKRE